MGYLEEMAEGGYDEEHIGKFHLRMIPYLVQTLNVRREDLIVDVGAAQGHCTISAKRAGYSNLAVLDLSPYKFDSLRDRYGIQCHVCNVEVEPFPFPDNAVGLVFAVHLIEHLKTTNNLLSEAWRVLRPGGALALVTPDWRKQYRTFWRDPTHVHPYDRHAIGRLLRMHRFAGTRVSSWGSAYGLGSLGAYRWWPRLGLIGQDLLGVGFKPAETAAETRAA